jgi:hypothetical protein
MKYISLAAYNNELIVVKDMDSFTNYFCYSKKQRCGSIDIPVKRSGIPVVDSESEDETEVLIVPHDIDSVEVQDVDDIL